MELETSVIGWLRDISNAQLDVRRTAENHLESQKFELTVVFLRIASRNDVDLPVRLQAAVYFKNIAKNYWKIEADTGDLLQPSDRELARNNIVELMLTSPSQIQNVLSEAIAYIGREDFPNNWPGLLDMLVDKLQTGDFYVINGVLRTAHTIFKRYRHEFKSEKLWQEISVVQNSFALPLTQLLDRVMADREQQISHADNSAVIYSSILAICKIFYSLSFQECLQVFEENMGKWMGHFQLLLQSNCDCLATSTDEEPSLVEDVRAQICENLSLYASKYDDSEEYDFSKFVPDLTQKVWELLTNTGPERKYDTLVSNAINFLSTIVQRPAYRQLFENENVLKTICERVIMPNMELRPCDLEDFNDEPENYIKFDLEGSDVGTRRYSSGQLVRSLCQAFEGPVITYFTETVKTFLDQYNSQPINCWRLKDVVIYLCSSMAAKGQTQRHGVTVSSAFLDVNDFFTSNVAPELTSPDVNQLPVIKADALKYVAMFRNQLNPNLIHEIFPVVVRFVGEPESTVVRTYAAYCVERLLMVRTEVSAAGETAGAGQTLFGPAELGAHADVLFTGLIQSLDKQGTNESEYVMKALMRTMHSLGQTLPPFLNNCMEPLRTKLIAVSRNPRKPLFNHYLFESICLALRVGCTQGVQAIDAFEAFLWPLFDGIFQNDVQDFFPYVFQILSMLIDGRPANSALPEVYSQLTERLLVPELWKRSANLPGLVRYFQAIIGKTGKCLSEEMLKSLLGVCQMLVASRANDHFGFALLTTVVVHVNDDALNAKVLTSIFNMLFQRLTRAKTVKYSKSFVVFLCLFAMKQGADKLLQLLDSIQPNLMQMTAENLIAANLARITGQVEQKTVTLGCAHIVASPSFFQAHPQLCWKLIEGVVEMLESAGAVNGNAAFVDGDHQPGDDGTDQLDELAAGSGDTFNRLAYGPSLVFDAVGGSLDDARVAFARYLNLFNQSQPGFQLLNRLKSEINGKAVLHLNDYFAKAGLPTI